MAKLSEAEKLAAKAAKEEKKLIKLEHDFALANPEFANFLKEQQQTNKKIAAMWDAVKQALVDAGITDVLENDLFRISLSRVFAIEVTDVNALPGDYTETIKIAKKDKIKKHFELYDELPAGVIDKSYFKLNKKVKGE